MQTLPISLEEAWSFFSNPGNLKKITPKDMDFTITSSDTTSFYSGKIITYTVRPLLNIRFPWVTEISHVKENAYFVDEQRIGPYRMWHHEHHFQVVEGGVKVVDIVTYKLPFGWLGNLMHSLFVRKRLQAIFDYRERVLTAEFAKQ